MQGHARQIHPGKPRCGPAPGPGPHLRDDASAGRVRHFAVAEALDVEGSDAQRRGPGGPQGPERGQQDPGPTHGAERAGWRDRHVPERGLGVRHTKSPLSAPAAGSKAHPSPASQRLPGGALGLPWPFYSLGETEAQIQGSHPPQGPWSAQALDSPGMWMGRYARLRIQVKIQAGGVSVQETDSRGLVRQQRQPRGPGGYLKPASREGLDCYSPTPSAEMDAGAPGSCSQGHPWGQGGRVHPELALAPGPSKPGL